ncbi:hypothetical protein AZE42_00062 [Rhizopogon vesiculosus]|uniref:F-box domain-containing protein n=1 Tax=Rhizopogon vesiculosus TaxID=180088 RepID=A0A1J8Q3D8_9AGAM|nr:hypothetical protein AZE42_00062 [Rhizopogon vesiculosus]
MEDLTLTSLPLELILEIYSALDWKTLLVCRQVCSLFRSIMESSGRARYDIELAVSGMMDGPPSSLTASDRLALLKERNAAWEALEWKASNDLSMQQGHLWELYGGVFAQSSPSNLLHFRQLPSEYRNIKEKSWHVALDVHVRDFTMDPAQDLLVLVEQPTLFPNANEIERQIRIHLRSLTTGDNHRLAPKPATLVHDFDVRGARPTYTLQVCGNLLGVYFMSHGPPTPELTVWNWTTGEVILTRFSPEVMTFAFLSSRFLLVGSIVDIETDNTGPRLYVLDMTQSSSEKILLTADYFCSFAWPQFDAWTNPVGFSIRSDPSPAWQPNPEARVPFSIAHRHRLFIITSCVITSEGHESSHDLFVPADTLLSHIEALPTATVPHDITWDEWGPTGTRLMQTPSSSPWVCNVFGTKFATLASRTRLYPDTLEVRDFNQLAMKRAAESCKNLASEDGIAQYVYDSSVIKAGEFLYDVRTSLPYRVTRRSLPHSFTQHFLTAVMCSEDNLILVDSNHRHLQVLTF